MKKFVVFFLAFLSILTFTLVSNAQELKVAETNSEYIEYWNLPEEERANRIMPAATIPRNYGSTVAQGRPLLNSNELPVKYDLRTNGKNGGVTEVENQRGRGICWAFSSLAVLESHLLINTGRTYNFSELHMDYATSMWCPDSKNYSEGTVNYDGFSKPAGSGGNLYYASAYMLSDKGVVDETQMPYNYTSDVVSLNKVSNAPSSNIWLKDYTILPTYSIMEGRMSEEQYRTIVKQYLMKYGALDVTVNTNSSMSLSSSTKAYYNASNRYNADHAVVLVGWDDNYSKNNFTVANGSPNTPKNNGAWIIQNTWGTGAGQNGYFYLSYEDKSFYTLGGTVVKAVSGKNYDKMYSYDPYGFWTAFGGTVHTIYGANVFDNATPGEQLKSVTIGIYDTCSYEVYVNPNGGVTNISSMIKVASGSFDYSGYKTIDLSNPVTLNGGKFAVVVKYMQNSGVYLPVEAKDSRAYNNVSAASGQSYYSTNGTSWTEISNGSGYNSFSNCSIKAFTDVPDNKYVNTATGVKAVSVSNTAVNVSWTNVSGAQKYYVFASTSPSGSFNQVGTAPANNFRHNGLSASKTYYYKVKAAKIVSGSEVTSDYSTVASTTTLAAPSFNSVSLSATSVNVGKAITVIANTSGYTDGLKYRFSYSYNGQSTVVFKNYGADLSASLTLSKAGTYTIYIDTMFTNGTTSRKTVTATAVDPYAFTVNSITVPAKANQGQTVTIKPNVSGNTSGLKYKFVWSYNNWSKWGVIRDFGTANIANHTLQYVGNYQFYVDVMGKDGRLVNRYATTSSLNPSQFSVSNVTAPSSAKQGTTVTIKTNAAGNTLGLKYKFVWSYNNWSKWGVISNFGTSNSANHKLQYVGRYDFYVDVMSVNGKIITSSTAMTATDPYSFSVTSVNAPTNGIVGNIATIKVGAAGYTNGLKYKFVWSYNNWSKWGVISDFSTSNTASITLKYPGKYEFFVDVMGVNGKVITRSAITNSSLGWSAASIGLSNSKVKVGSSIKITGTTIGGSNLKYKFVWSNNNWSKWGVISSDSTNNTCYFKPTVAGNITIYMDVTDIYGNVKTISKTISVY